MTQISDLAALRAIVPEPNPMTRAKVLDHLDGQGLDFISRAPFLLLSTANAAGEIEVSPKGDGPGFVRAENSRSLIVPDRAGNNLAFGHANVLENPNVGIIFLLPNAGETLRVSGRATLHDDADICAKLAARGQPPKLFMRVAVKRAYFHCARSILRAELWQPESWGGQHKVSFGRIFREQTGADEKLSDLIDADVNAAYKFL